MRLADGQSVLQNANPVELRNPRLLQAGMVGAVCLVFGLAYLDLSREQRRALEDFTADQSALSRALAANLEARLGGAPADLDAAAQLAGPAQVESPGPTRWILLDDARRWIVFSPGGAVALRGTLDDATLAADVRNLLDGMARGGAGAVQLERAAAGTLGLERRMAVAGFAPVKVAGRAWSLAVVASAMRVRDRARVSAWRLGAATGVAGLLVGLFGFVIRRQQQRATELAEALRIAEATAALRNDLQRAEKLATIGTLAAGIAHEVGTPLGIISGRAEQLLSKLPPDAEPSRKALTSIIAQVDKVSTTIRQLLDFARVRPVEAVNVPPRQILETAASLLEHRFRQSKVALTVEAPASVPPVRGDAGQLEQVFVNLLMNAADACAAGGQVRAQASRSGDQVTFEIVDDGCGISDENLPHVLDPFFTTKKRGQGTGLGLSIAADIVKNHGGQLEILQATPKGTRVCVHLPVAS
jgi:signal transduction histidine kinase